MIDRFEGKHEFLRNDYPCNVVYDGEVYPSGEHAFQAAKTDNLELRKKIQNASLNEARKIGKKEIQLSTNWEQSRLSVMEKIQSSKFSQLKLKMQLLLTGDQDLIQGGMYQDTFWGQNENGYGENHMGEIIMKIRNDIFVNEGAIWDLIKKEFEKLDIASLFMNHVDFDYYGPGERPALVITAV